MQLRSGRSYGARGRSIGLRGRIRKGRRFGVRPMYKRQRPGPPLAPRHRKRSASGLSSESKRQKTYRDPNQYRQMETLTSKRGRKDKKRVYLDKLVRGSLDFHKYTCRVYNADNSAGLRQPLGLETVGNVQYMPVLCINLTELPQYFYSGQQDQPAFWRLTQDFTTGVIGFQQLSTMTNAGTFVGNGWQQYNTLNPLKTTTPTRRALMEWINMRYRIRAPTGKPTRVVCQVVQPYAWFQGMPEELLLTGGASLANEHYQPWINMAARNTVNPVQNIPVTAGRKPWKVINSKVFELQPTSTTETDAYGHDVVQKYFWRCNKLVQYDTQPYANTDDVSATNTNIGIISDGSANVAMDVPKGQRLYMIISAYVPNGSASLDLTIHPTFEFSFEKKLSVLTGGG